ncbi:hypothetical protein KP509_16G066100 [Ceratopteris richardii]|uniref:Protein kinase domain-containing protein n=1 Tax=Ceratopteris richardii TaxID=49495 RepID=A0A8T2SZI7_CERRI|nr:hypothetical protein KP509_16G066100 [Ceratopteris richardii]
MACHCSIRRWVRGSLVGAGSFGKVNLALDVASGELFAVKSIDCSRRSGGSDAEVSAMENELQLLQSLDSPFVIRCYGGDETWENGARMKNLFMEYMAGGSLADLMKKFGGSLDEGLIKVYTRGIVEGLAYLHGQGIVHCDIKGKNVLIGSTGVKIADFGSAKRVGQQGHAMKGTPLWMAPEVIMQEEQSAASDIWSLGCTVVEMATGRPPWSDTHFSPLAALMRIGVAQESPPLPDSLSSDAKDFLSKCLQREPKHRWSAAQLLEHPFLQRPNAHEGRNSSTLCKHRGSVPPAPLSPTSVLDAGDADSTSSWCEESNGRIVPLLHCLEIGSRRLETHEGECITLASSSTSASPSPSSSSPLAVATQKREISEHSRCTPPVAPNDVSPGGMWITVRSPRPSGEDKQRPLSDFMLGTTAAEMEVGGARADTPRGALNVTSLQALQFLRFPRRPPLPMSSSRHHSAMMHPVQANLSVRETDNDGVGPQPAR